MVDVVVVSSELTSVLVRAKKKNSNKKRAFCHEYRHHSIIWLGVSATTGIYQNIIVYMFEYFQDGSPEMRVQYFQEHSPYDTIYVSSSYNKYGG